MRSVSDGMQGRDRGDKKRKSPGRSGTKNFAGIGRMGIARNRIRCLPRPTARWNLWLMMSRTMENFLRAEIVFYFFRNSIC